MSFEYFIKENYDIKDTTDSIHIRICCPFCGEGDYKGYINLKKNLFKCWKCLYSHKPTGEALTAYQFIKHAHSLSHQDIIDILNTDRLFISESRYQVNQDTRELVDSILNKEYYQEDELFPEIELPEYCERVSRTRKKYYNNLALEYLSHRFGTSIDVFLEKYEFYYCYDGEYNSRIILPVYLGNKLVYYQGRSFIPNTKLKYINPPIPKPIFGLDDAGDELFICEGIFDAMMVGQGGITLFGLSLTKKQSTLLRNKSIKKATIVLDPDEAGIKAVNKLANKLKLIGIENINVALGLDSDPADLGPGARSIIKQHSIPYNFQLELDLII